MGSAISVKKEENMGIVSEPEPVQPVALSIVIPIYNEAQNITVIYQRICKIMNEEGKAFRDSYEILFIDDGSTDGSYGICVNIQEKDPRVRVIQFRRNFGKTAALQAGFSFSSGSYIVSIDCDMQEDPADMFNLLSLLNNGYDMVCGWRKERHDPLSKIIPSRLFNWAVAGITGIRLHDFNCGFKAYRSEVIKEIKLYGELHRFIPVLAFQRGFKVTELPVRHQGRQFGRSKFGAKRLIKGYLDFIQVLFLTNFIKYPLRLFGAIGTILSMIGILILIYLTILWFDGIRPIGDRPLMTLGVLLTLMGVQLFSIGFIGEIMRDNYYRAEEEYAISKTAGFTGTRGG
jgi:glycosyltransferase involved in cell wall biosynthesis